MTDTTPDADELQLRTRLQQLVDGPAAQPPAIPPGHPSRGYRSAERPRDWLDDFLDSPTTPPAARTEEEALGRQKQKRPPASPTRIAVAKPKKRNKKRRKKHDPNTPRTAFDTRADDPRQSLLDAWQRIPYRIRWLGYHAIAAAAGWRLGWVDWSTDTAAWYAAGHWLSPSAFALYVLGTCTVALYRRSRRWAWPAAWTAAIPVSSIVAGVLLYGTGYQP